MIRLYLLLFYLLLPACGGSSVVKPAPILAAESYMHEGLQAFSDDDWSQAQQLFTRAMLLYQGEDNQQGVLVSHINLAEVAHSLHEYSLSQKHLDAAAYIVKKNLSTDFQARITLLHSLNALKQKKISLAESMIQPLLPEFSGDTLVSTPNSRQLVAIAHRTKIAFVQQQGESLWTRRYAKALSVSAVKKHSLAARLLRFQSILLQRQGNYEEAEAKLQQALLDYKSISSRLGIAATLAELGQLAVTESRWQEARDYFSRAIAVFRYLKDFARVSQLTESLVQLKLE